MGQDEEALRRDINALEFNIGARRGKWKAVGIYFPFALFYVCAPLRKDSPANFLLRAQCDGYSGIPPISQLWHGGRNCPLPDDQKPRAKEGVMDCFKDWGPPCLYHPVDRLARDHGNWAQQHRNKIWTPDKNITFLLETVYDLLNCSVYLGAEISDSALEVPQEFVDTNFLRAA